MKKIRVGILFGGKSAEHEVSLQTARNILEAIDTAKYEVTLIGVSKEGRWYLNEASNFLLNAENPKLIAFNQSAGTSIALNMSANEPPLVPMKNTQQALGSLDVVFPVIHGPMGEDGTVQGLLKLANIPFVGADVLGSAVGMDKDAMKRLLKESGLPVPPFKTFRYDEIDGIDEAALVQLLGLPLFVKPCNLGSSVGIFKIKEKSQIKPLLRQSAQYDEKIIVESYVPAREIEISVLGNENPIVSLPGEVIPKNEFYDYEAKYISNTTEFHTPAHLPPEVVKEVQELAVKAFRSLYCSGLARIDFFYKENGELLINEINTIPGFTKMSMYPRMWASSGISYSDLIDRLIQLALERHQRMSRLKSCFEP